MLDPEEFKPVTCHICGAFEKNEYMQHVHDRLFKDKLCFTCAFWTDRIGEDTVRVNGHCYHVGDEAPTERMFRGHGGAEFNIIMSYGTQIKSTNLWHRGEIPLHFRKQLYNNARFFRQPCEHNTVWPDGVCTGCNVLATMMPGHTEPYHIVVPWPDPTTI